MSTWNFYDRGAAATKVRQLAHYQCHMAQISPVAGHVRCTRQHNCLLRVSVGVIGMMEEVEGNMANI